MAFIGQLGRFSLPNESTSVGSSSRSGLGSGQKFWSTSGGRQGGQATQLTSRIQLQQLSLHAAPIATEAGNCNRNSSQKKNSGFELQVRD